jgi:hypothetical protein
MEIPLRLFSHSPMQSVPKLTLLSFAQSFLNFFPRPMCFWVLVHRLVVKFKVFFVLVSLVP